MRITWSEGRWFPGFIKGGAMGIVDGLPVYAGGVSQPWRETEMAWYYDSDRKDWFPAEPMPLGRCYTTGCTAGRGLLVVGGRKSTPKGAIVLDDAWLLERTRGGRVWKWTELPHLRQARAVAGLAVVGNLAICAGGGDWERTHGGAFTAASVTTVEALDLTNPKAGWVDLGAPPFSPRASCSAAGVGGSFYLFGGYECRVNEQKERHFEYYDDAYRYDPSTGRWSEIAPLPVKLRGNEALAYADRYVILMGGCATIPFMGQDLPYLGVKSDPRRKLIIGEYSDLVWVYDTMTDSYALLPERLPHGHNDVHGCINGTTIYLVGGENVDATTSNTTDTFMIGEIREQA